MKNIKLDVLPTEVFYDWLRSQGKEGGQTKFPRVLKKEKLESWLAFVGSKGLICMDVIINGLLFGLLLCVLIGPVFFALIQNAIEKGFFSGFFMAVGIALSDTIYILITYLGISQLVDNPSFNMWLGGVGGGNHANFWNDLYVEARA